MKIGKLNITDLKELIFSNITNRNKKILATGEIGNDCSAIEVDNNIIYLSSDPITGATKNIGALAVNINCNDIATEGIVPTGIMLTILAPEITTKDEIATIMKDAEREATKLGITILGGHTEITSAVNRIIISATVIGIGDKESFKKRKTIKSGDRLVITKGVGIEGIGIIASEKEEELKKYISADILSEAKALLAQTSVVKEGILANSIVKSMHDVTEGGILGAIWESASYHNLGVEIEYNNIYIPNCVKVITDYYNIDPLRLISSGTMLMIVDKEKSETLLTLLKDNDIKAYDIGYFTNKQEKILIRDKLKENITPPDSDELYKII